MQLKKGMSLPKDFPQTNSSIQLFNFQFCKELYLLQHPHDTVISLNIPCALITYVQHRSPTSRQNLVRTVVVVVVVHTYTYRFRSGHY